MIGYLNGKLLHQTANTLIINVRGVGYEVEVHDRVLHHMPQVGDAITVFTYHHVREDTSALFGFCNIDEKNVFQHLLKVNGVGPRLALTIIGYLSPGALIQAILQEDLATLKPIKGLGPTVAKRMVMDLKKPFSTLAPAAPLFSDKTPTSSLPWQDAVLVLTRLGYKHQQAEKVVHTHRSTATDLDHLIRLALKDIAKDVGVR